jgi:hypothetical protein
MPQLFHPGRLNRHLRFGGFGADLEPLLFDLQQLLSSSALARDCFRVSCGYETVFGQFLVHLEIEFGAVVVGVDRRHRRLEVQSLRLQLHPQIDQFGFRPFELPFGVERRLLDFRIGELDENGVRLDRRTREHADCFDSTRADGGHPDDGFRHQGSVAAHFERQIAALHGVHPDLALIDRRRRRFQSGEPDVIPARATRASWNRSGVCVDADELHWAAEYP